MYEELKSRLKRIEGFESFDVEKFTNVTVTLADGSSHEILWCNIFDYLGKDIVKIEGYNLDMVTLCYALVGEAISPDMMNEIFEY